MNFSALRSLSLRSMVEAAADDENEKKRKEEEEKKKKEQQEQEENPDETKEEETPDEQTEDEAPEDAPEDEAETEDPPADEGDENDPAGEDEPPAEGDNEGTDEANPDDPGGDGMGDDFGLDPEGGEEDLGPAPDGLPEADDDGSGEEEASEDDEEMNVQVNILKLSGLDRALAKKTCFQFFMDLRSKIQANLAIIDKSETVIDPDYREKITDKLNTTATQLDQFLEYKLPLMNYEEAIQAYYIFVKDINTALEEVKSEGIVDGKHKHKNKESS